MTTALDNEADAPSFAVFANTPRNAGGSLIDMLPTDDQQPGSVRMDDLMSGKALESLPFAHSMTFDGRVGDAPAASQSDLPLSRRPVSELGAAAAPTSSSELLTTAISPSNRSLKAAASAAAGTGAGGSSPLTRTQRSLSMVLFGASSTFAWAMPSQLQESAQAILLQRLGLHLPKQLQIPQNVVKTFEPRPNNINHLQK